MLHDWSLPLGRGNKWDREVSPHFMASETRRLAREPQLTPVTRRAFCLGPGLQVQRRGEGRLGTSIEPAGLGKGLRQAPVQGAGRGADKTSRSCLLFAWRKAAKGFSKTIYPLVGDSIPSLPWARLPSCLGPARTGLAPRAQVLCSGGSSELPGRRLQKSCSLLGPNKAGILGWELGIRAV